MQFEDFGLWEIVLSISLTKCLENDWIKINYHQLILSVIILIFNQILFPPTLIKKFVVLVLLVCNDC